VQVHHASQGGGESHAVGDGPITVKSDHLVLFGHVVQKTENRKNKTIHRFCDLISLNVFKYGQVFLNSRPKEVKTDLFVHSFPATSLKDFM
jgi:hypothetical protein